MMSYLPPAVQRWLTALDSGWRAGMKQYRRARTLQRNAARIDDPFAS
jgi:hypothetical protein